MAQTLTLQGKYAEAVEEMISLGDRLEGTRKGVRILFAAAKMAATELADTTKTIEILDHIGEVYEKTDVGQQAKAQASSIRGLMTQ